MTPTIATGAESNEGNNPPVEGGWVTRQVTPPAGKPMRTQGNLQESGDMIEIVPGDEKEWIPIPAVPKTVSYP